MKTLLFLAASLWYSSQGCLKMDLVLLGDLSGSCQGKEKYIGDAFISIIEKLEMGEENVKISVVTFNSWSKVHVGLVVEKVKLCKQLSLSRPLRPISVLPFGQVWKKL